MHGRRRHRAGAKRDPTVGPYVPGPNVKYCSATGKVKYKTKDKALGDAKRISPGGLSYVRPYQCQFCRKYHLTTHAYQGA